MKTKKLTLNNSFHRSSVTLRIPIKDARIDGIVAEFIVSHGQFKRALKTLCNSNGGSGMCYCRYNTEPHFWGETELRYVELQTRQPFDYKAYTA